MSKQQLEQHKQLSTLLWHRPHMSHTIECTLANKAYWIAYLSASCLVPGICAPPERLQRMLQLSLLLHSQQLCRPVHVCTWHQKH